MPDRAISRGSWGRRPGHGVREHWDAGPPQTGASPPCPTLKTRGKRACAATCLQKSADAPAQKPGHPKSLIAITLPPCALFLVGRGGGGVFAVLRRSSSVGSSARGRAALSLTCEDLCLQRGSSFCPLCVSMCPAKSRDLAPPEPHLHVAPHISDAGRVVVKCQTRNYESVKSSPPTGSLARLAGGRSMLHSGQPPPTSTARRPRTPPPCPSRTHGPSDLRWRPPPPQSRTPCSGTHAATTRLGVKKKTLYTKVKSVL